MHGVAFSSMLPQPGEDLLGSTNVSVPVATVPVGFLSGSEDSVVKVLAHAGVVGQFDDPDDESSASTWTMKQQPLFPLTQPAASAQASATDNPLDFLAAACDQELLHTDEHPPPKIPSQTPRLERRISAATCSAMSNLLSLANAQVSPTIKSDVAHPEPTPDDHGSTANNDKRVQKRKHQKTWQERVDELIAFKAQFGHLRIKQYAKGHEEEKQLGGWLANCRSRFRAGKLNPSKAARLREIGCEGFGEEKADSDSESNEEDTASENKGMDPPAFFRHEDVYEQSQKQEATPQPRRSSNTSFNTNDSEEAPSHKRCRKSFEDRLQEMRAFFLQNGHVHVMTRGEHKELGRWLSHTRTRARDGTLSPEHLEMFNAMLAWDAAPMKQDPPEDGQERHTLNRRNSATSAVSSSNDDDDDTESFNREPGSKRKRAPQKGWEASFQDLVAFKEKHGHVNCRIVKNDENEQLAKWLSSNRSRFRLGYLHDAKVERLRNLGCTGFEPISESTANNEDADAAEFAAAITLLASTKAPVRDAESTTSEPKRKRKRNTYETRIEHIKEFKEQHGHCKITFNPEDKHEEQLARWLASVRSRHRAGTLQPERSSELHDLGCEGFEPSAVMPTTASSMEMDHADDDDDDDGTNSVAPAARTATPSPPPSPKTKKQRTKAIRQSWDDMFSELQDFQIKCGVGCTVPKPEGDAGKLGRWLAFQRRCYIAGKLPRDRVERLQEIGRTEFLDREEGYEPPPTSVVMMEDEE